jgi:hypothetical protein
MIPALQRSRIFELYGVSDMPEPESEIQSDNGPRWHWFMLNIMPLDENLKYKFIGKTSLAARLSLMKKILLLLIQPYVASLGSGGSAASSLSTASQSQGSEPAQERDTHQANNNNDNNNDVPPSDSTTSASSLL